MSQQQPPFPGQGNLPDFGNYPGQYPLPPWRKSENVVVDALRVAVHAAASLKLTVGLFAVSILLILFGTLAQAEPGMDIWRVIDQYFRTFVAKVELKIFTPKAFFPQSTPAEGWFPFPGGYLIGGLMALNLLAAHALRFTVQARGPRLWTGLGVIGIGCISTVLVIASGGTGSGSVQDQPFIDWSVLWRIFQGVLALLGAASIYGAIMLNARRKIERISLGGLAVAILATLTWTLVQGESGRLSDPSMRILWQLLKAQFAATILLTGCIMVFHKRGGVVLLHAGIGLLMISELMVAKMAVESQMTIYEGETSNYAHDIRSIELAVVTPAREKLEQAGLFAAAPLLGAVGSGGVEIASDFDTEIVIPKGWLAEGERIQSEKLPFDFEVRKFYQNSKVLRIQPGDTPSDEHLADQGIGRHYRIEEVRPGAGTDSGGGIDISSAYITFYKKGTDESLGTHLLSMVLAMSSQPMAEKVTVNGETYDLYLRSKRIYKPYTVHAIDVRRENYIGTQTPKDYSSVVRVDHPAQAQPYEVKIWMNNPLRAYGETFYQSGYNLDPEDGREITTLQVVTNFGWMIPYVCCMIVGTGMFYQFWLVLMRFLRRRSAPETLAKLGLMAIDSTGFTAASAQLTRTLNERRKQQEPSPLEPDGNRPGKYLNWIMPIGVLAVAVVMAGMIARPPKAKEGQVDYYAAGKLPLVYEGRMKPLDTLARNSLLILSNSESFSLYDVTLSDIGSKADRVRLALRNANADFDEQQLPQMVLKDAPSYVAQKLVAELKELGAKASAKRHGQPAMRWLMELMARPEVADTYPIFRIENQDLQVKLNLERRDGMRYAYSEFEPHLRKLADDYAAAIALDQEHLSTFQRKMLDFDKKRQLYLKLRLSFSGMLPDLEGSLRQLPEIQHFAEMLQQLQRSQPPLTIPPTDDDPTAEESPTWEVFPKAWALNQIRTDGGLPPNKYVVGLQKVLTSYQKLPRADHVASDAAAHRANQTPAKDQPESEKSAADFNGAVEDYHSLIDANPEVEPLTAKISFESYFNSVSPFFYSACFYLVAFVLTACSWLGWTKAFNRAALWLIVFTFLIHTFALVGRIYISGRPPVTNLYSSAVFIGWGMVVLGIAIEAIFRIGVGNIVASVAGFKTLGIAHFLAGDGDTFVVMQAVLDTQFWLATHVICITLGYATTYLAGLLGLIYIIRGVATPSLTPKLERELYRMTYGTLCFSLFFSFVGTVLGGLWADDSWGRFWGWDPKENGALIIVLWNALILHARWDGMVKERGTAVLSVAGMMFVSWSWFGVNELGAGLHSYGFTEGVMLSLSIAWGVMLAFVGLGCLPKDVWWSFAARAQEAENQRIKRGRAGE